MKIQHNQQKTKQFMYNHKEFAIYESKGEFTLNYNKSFGIIRLIFRCLTNSFLFYNDGFGKRRPKMVLKNNGR